MGGDKAQTSGDSSVSRRLSFSRPLPVPGNVVGGTGTSGYARATLPHQIGQDSAVQIDPPGSPAGAAEHGRAFAPKSHIHGDNHTSDVGGPWQVVTSHHIPDPGQMLHHASGMAGGGFSSLANGATTPHSQLAEPSQPGPLQELDHEAGLTEAHVPSEPTALRGARIGKGLRTSGQEQDLGDPGKEHGLGPARIGEAVRSSGHEQDLGVPGREHGLGQARPEGGAHAVGRRAPPGAGLGTAACAPWVASLDAQVQHASNSEVANRNLR